MAGNDKIFISEADALIKVASIPGYWASLSGAEGSVTPTEVWNGGAKTAVVITGKKTISNIVLKKPFLPHSDIPFARRFDVELGKRIDTITVQYTDANGQAVGKPRVLSGCVLVKNTWPNSDVASNNPAMWTVEYKPQSQS